MNVTGKSLWAGLFFIPGIFIFWTGYAGTVDPVRGDQGMVVAGHPEAAGIGLAVLQSGGNAMDAVVATSLALGVAEPYGSGLGGKGAILYYEAASGTVWFIDGMDAAGQAFDVKALGALSRDERAQGGQAIGVPGLLAALASAHERWGRTPWPELVLPSAALAERGFTMVPGMEVFFGRRLERIRSHPETTRIYLPDGNVPGTGDRLPCPDLARTLRIIAEKGHAGFYEGDVARRIVEAVQASAGHLTIEDFRGYAARMGPVLSVQVNGIDIHAAGPPTTGGATALLSLKVLHTDQWDLDSGLYSVANLDRWGRVLRHVYPAIQARVADVDGAAEAWAALASGAGLEAVRDAAALTDDADREAVPLGAGEARGGGWTTHFVVADADGNVASVTQSLSHHFGSGVTAPGTGVVLNNSLTNFSFTDPEGANYGAPGKRPRSTIAPVIALQEGRPCFALGLPGGGRIPTATLAVLADHVVFGRSLGEAIAAPRVHLLRSWSDEPDSNVMQIEQAVPAVVRNGLSDLGWEVEVITDTEFFGGMNAIELSPDGGLTGWADFRRTNAACGY